MLIDLDGKVSVNRKDVLSVEMFRDITKSLVLNEIKVVMAQGGHLKVGVGLDEAIEKLNLVKVNNEQAVNPDTVCAITLDVNLKVRVFSGGGGFLYADGDYSSTCQLFKDFYKTEKVVINDKL